MKTYTEYESLDRNESVTETKPQKVRDDIPLDRTRSSDPIQGRESTSERTRKET